ncbi:MAG: hypothetical protein ABJD13_05385 [Paracoccaceae bacterium]
MKSSSQVLVAALLFSTLSPALTFAEDELAKAAFDDAISAAEMRDYAMLASIVQLRPEALTHRTPNGDDLYHEFRYIFHADTGGLTIDLKAIGTLLDNGVVPNVSNGLLGTLLSEANNFGSQVEALPIESGACLENREKFFPVIDNLIEAGAKFGKFPVSIEDLEPTEAFYYQYQLCHRVFICGGVYERPSEIVRRRVSESTTSLEKDFLLRLASDGGQDMECLVQLNDW